MSKTPRPPRDPKDFARSLIKSSITAGIYALFRRLPRTAIIAILAALIAAAYYFELY